MLIEPSDDKYGDDNIENGLHDVGEHQLVELKESEEKTKLSLNAISETSLLSKMQLRVWIGKHEASLLVDSKSTHNFASAKIARSWD